MKIFHWISPEGNVGDDLNLWMWPRLFGCDFFDGVSDPLFIGIGSVLDNRHEQAASRLVFGAGARSAATIPDISKPGWDVAFVRGPHTAAALGLGADRWISDPAILAPLADPQFKAKMPGRAPRVKGSRIGFIPYYATHRRLSQAIADAAGFELIPATLDPERFFRRLLSCDAVITEAMHGAILADAFGVPWIPCRMYNVMQEGDTHIFKWSDWLDTLELNPAFVSLNHTNRILGGSLKNDLIFIYRVRSAAIKLHKHIAKYGWCLSERTLLKEHQDRMLHAIAMLRGR